MIKKKKNLMIQPHYQNNHKKNNKLYIIQVIILHLICQINLVISISLMRKKNLRVINLITKILYILLLLMH